MALTKQQVVDTLAGEFDLTKAVAKALIERVGNLLVTELGAGEDFILPGVGRFSVSKRAARTGRNPRTGEPLKIAASKVVRFSAAKPFKEAVNSKKGKRTVKIAK